MDTRRNKNLTKEQKMVWASITGEKFPDLQYRKTEGIKTISDIEYMENCLYWIKESRAGRIDKAKEKSAAQSMIYFCQQILK